LRAKVFSLPWVAYHRDVMAYTSPTSEPRSGDVTVNGIRLHYLDWGGDGPPLVILHATGFLGRIYRPIAEALTTIGHVYSYDQRGHGDSERPALDQIGWDQTADDLEGFLVAMKLEGANALGHSAGATAIGAVASRRPDLIARAVLAEPVIVDTANPQQGPYDLRQRTLRRRRSFESLDAMYRNFEHKPPYDTWRRDILRDYCEFGTRQERDGRRELKCPPEIEAQFYATAGSFDGLSMILRCEVPMMVLFGEKSDSPLMVFKDRIAANSTIRRVDVMPGAGHFLPMEKPEEVARMALEFLRAE
jgi:pimeloyl-ACP methyl ester carboxylesterase